MLVGASFNKIFLSYEFSDQIHYCVVGTVAGTLIVLS